MFTTTVFYNSTNLSTLPGVKVTSYNVTEMPTRTLNNSKLARADKSLLTSAEYAKKSIFVTGFVGGANRDIMEQNYDVLKGAIQLPEGQIKVTQGGSNVYYTGTLNAITKTYTGPTLGFVFEFVCSDPIGLDVDSTTLITDTVTTSSQTWIINVAGSYKALPVIKATINSLTDSGDNTISFQNAATGTGIKIEQNFNAGDIIVIDCLAMSVLVNSTAIDFSGAFPNFFPGSRTFQYIDDFSARNVSLLVTYNKRYA